MGAEPRRPGNLVHLAAWRATRRPLPTEPRWLTPDDQLVAIDRDLAAAEERLNLARGRLNSARGWRPTRQAEHDIAELTEAIAELQRERLRIAGPELCLVRGGLGE